MRVALAVALALVMFSTFLAVNRLDKPGATSDGSDGRAFAKIESRPRPLSSPIASARPRPRVIAGPFETSVPRVGAPESTSPAPVPAAVKASLPSGSIVVSTDGRPTGAGTLERPLDLGSALGARSPVRPGGTVLLRSGVYRGAFKSVLRGTRTEPITVRSFPGEWAVIDGGSLKETALTISGADTWFRDLEVMKSDPRRRTDVKGPHPREMPRSGGHGIDVFGPRTKLIHLIVHDNGEGVGFWKPAVDAEIYGSLIFNNGWVGGDRGWGHGTYTQNVSGTKRITDTVFFNNFGYGIHGYGVNGSVVGYQVQGVTSFENGAPAGGRNPNVLFGPETNSADRISLRSSVLYHRPKMSGQNLQLGLGGVENQAVTIEDNRILGGTPSISMRNWRQARVVGNTIRTQQDDEKRLLVDLIASSVAMRGADGSGFGYTWNRNSYLDVSERKAPTSFRLDNGADREALTFGGWRERTSLDGASSYQNADTEEADVILRADRYEPGRAIVTVVNRDGRSSVRIDPALSGMKPSTRFEIRDAQNIFGDPLASGVWSGGPIEIPLRRASAVQPIGTGYVPVEHTLPDFGVFVLLPLAMPN